jgi:hypothetical protein
MTPKERVELAQWVLANPNCVSSEVYNAATAVIAEALRVPPTEADAPVALAPVRVESVHVDRGPTPRKFCVEFYDIRSGARRKLLGREAVPTVSWATDVIRTFDADGYIVTNDASHPAPLCDDTGRKVTEIYFNTERS